MKAVNKTLVFLFMVLSLALNTGQAASVFKPVQVYGGGYVTGIVFHPAQNGLAYARTDMGGVYRWNSASADWTPLTDFLNRDQADFMGNLALALDAQDATRVYVMCGKYTQSWAGNGALLRSTDQGATWSIITLPFKVGGNEDGRTAGERMAVDPNLGSILFAGSNLSSLYKSVNYGTNWALVNTFPATNITFVTFDKSSGSSGSATPNIYVGINASTNNLYRSTDGGATWGLLAGQPTGNIPLRAAWGQGRLYITYANALGPNGVSAGAAWRFDPAGPTWTNLNPPAGQGGWCGVGVFPGASDRVALATLDRWWPADEVYLSTNSGGAWTAKLTGATMNETQAPWVVSSNPHWLSDIEIDPFNSDHAMFVTGYGVYRTTNLSAATPTWSFASKGIEQTVPTQLISPPSGANLLSAMGDVDGFKHDNLDAPPSLRHQPEVGTTLGIAFAESLPSKMVKASNASPYGAYSINSGANWTAFAAFPAGASGGGTRSIAISPDGASILWAPAGGALSRSTNNGGAWTACGGAPPAGMEPVADRVNSSKFYYFQTLDTGNSRLWRSTDAGANFALAAANLPTLPSYQYGDFSLKATLGREGDLWLTTGASGLYHSIDSGVTFQKVTSVSAAYEVSTGLGSGPYPAVYAFATVGGLRGFYRSDDAGNSWTRFNDDQHQYGWIHDFSGDPRIYGRLYLSAEGRGVLYTDTASSASPTVTPTRSHTATFTATRSSTPSYSPTPTFTVAPPTATRSATPTLSPSATHSPSSSFTLTPSGSPSASPSPTPAQSPTFTATATASPTLASTATFSHSPTRSATPSYTSTQSSTPTATFSRTNSHTRTATPTRSATPTYSVSSTPSATPSISPTFTDVPLGSTDTATPTVTPSSTASPSVTATETATDIETLTATETLVSSDTATETVTETATSVSTQTATPSFTALSSGTQTASATRSASPTLNPTGSPTLASTFSATATHSPTLAASPSSTPSLASSSSVTPMNSATATVMSSATATATPTMQASPSATSLPAAESELIEAWALPNPQSGDKVLLRFKINGNFDKLSLKLYTPGMTAVTVLKQDGPWLGSGWHSVAFDAPGLGNGLFWFVLSGEGQGKQVGLKQIGQVYRIR